ncbi:MAG: 3'-5' exonuclease [Candidatus Marinimicrobia bacterium]|jgi:DNA polymerase III epsilon subunit family exonuclease|nr:3'-5' exonuclease [Candidatus Neomarinimicrobiota bacterium]MBT4295884.1 3'-5' exonuclease [Candidatus Neomarinimicrobiota bacterium]
MFKEFCSIDVETSGLSYNRGDRVLEYAAVKFNTVDILEEKCTLINVPCIIHPDAQRVHGIDVSMLSRKPDPKTAWDDFLQFIDDSTLVAHNAKFDVNFIRMELNRFGKRFTNPIFCTLIQARKQFPHLENYRLETVATSVLGAIPSEYRLHRALDDARLVAHVWMKMNK